MSHPSIPSTFGARVAYLRALTAGPGREPLSCSQVDRIAGLHRGHVWQIEQGSAENPKADTVRKLAEALGCTVGWLLAGEGLAPSPEAVRAVTAGSHPADESADESADAPDEVAADAEPSGPVVVRDGFDQTGTGG